MNGGKMRPVRQLLIFLPLFLISNFLDKSIALCALDRGVVARCHSLEDAKYIDTDKLHTLHAVSTQKRLSPKTFQNLTSLRHLNLSKGNLKKIEPGTFAKLNNLLSLDLSDNLIEDLKLGTFKGLKRLHTLRLERNAISQLPPELITLKSLRLLDITGNPFDCNCASLKVRDALVNRGVKISKRALCSGPVGLKGVSFTKPETHLVCMFELQDGHMQMDQPLNIASEEGSGDDYYEKSDYVDTYDEKTEEQTTLKPTTPEETPAPSQDVTVESSTKSFVVTSVTSENHNTSIVDEIFFDTEEGDNKTNTSSRMASLQSTIAKLNAVEGSGEIDDEGSGLEGSGTGIPHIDWSKIQEEEGSNEDYSPPPEDTSLSTTSGESLLDILWGVFWTTAAPEEKKEPDLEEEQFIHVTQASNMPMTEEEIITKIAAIDEATVSGTGGSEGRPLSPKNINEPTTTDDILGKLRDAAEETSEEMGDVSPARQSKKGMGSYVVLAALLAVLAGLIGFAAYKGDFCRNKRKRGDVEAGTEMKDMQKSLLDVGNTAQPKIAPNGNAEVVPLVDHKDVEDHQGDRKIRNGNGTTEETKLRNGSSENCNDPVKPPRKSMLLQDSADNKPETNGTSCQDAVAIESEMPNSTPESMTPMHLTALQSLNRPPVSPGAQRVKITLQENPDSVPKTPVLITRLKSGENLVKTP